MGGKDAEGGKGREMWGTGGEGKELEEGRGTPPNANS